MRSKMLTGLDDGEVDKSNEHGGNGTESVKHAISHVDLHVELVNEHATEHENRNDVDDKAVSSPS